MTRRPDSVLAPPDGSTLYPWCPCGSRLVFDANDTLTHFNSTDPICPEYGIQWQENPL